MKYALLIIAIFALTSCKKKGCYKCQSTQYHANLKFPDIKLPAETKCDMTNDEIREYEKKMSFAAQDTSGNTAYSLTTVCNKE